MASYLSALLVRSTPYWQDTGQFDHKQAEWSRSIMTFDAVSIANIPEIEDVADTCRETFSAFVSESRCKRAEDKIESYAI